VRERPELLVRMGCGYRRKGAILTCKIEAGVPSIGKVVTKVEVNAADTGEAKAVVTDEEQAGVTGEEEAWITGTL